MLKISERLRNRKNSHDSGKIDSCLPLWHLSVVNPVTFLPSISVRSKLFSVDLSFLLAL